jgi:HSP20 family protein
MELLFNLQHDIEHAFTRLIDEPWGRFTSTAWQPAIDLYETADAYHLEADLPGVDPDSVELRVEGKQVSLCGTRNMMVSITTRREVMRERSMGHFCRTLTVRHEVDTEHISFDYDRGIYRAELPKAAGSEEASSGDSGEGRAS